MTDLREQIANLRIKDMRPVPGGYQIGGTMADAILEVIRGAVKPLEWRMAHDHWRAASPEGVYSVGDAGGGYAFVSAPFADGVRTMRVYPFDMGKPVADALHAGASILAALGVE